MRQARVRQVGQAEVLAILEAQGTRRHEDPALRRELVDTETGFDRHGLRYGRSIGLLGHGGEAAVDRHLASLL